LGCKLLKSWVIACMFVWFGSNAIRMLSTYLQ
jgi:hypothetical protein